MSRKVYTQAQMSDALHNAVNKARFKQIQRSAEMMQSVKDETHAREADIVTLQAEIDVLKSENADLKDENTKLRSGRA